MNYGKRSKTTTSDKPPLLLDITLHDLSLFYISGYKCTMRILFVVPLVTVTLLLQSLELEMLHLYNQVFNHLTSACKIQISNHCFLCLLLLVTPCEYYFLHSCNFIFILSHFLIFHIAMCLAKRSCFSLFQKLQ